MAFYRRLQQPVNKKWYPRSVVVGNVTTEQVAKRIAAESTVSPADVKAVLSALSGVMGDYMSQGLSVKLDGIGSFYFTADSRGNGVETEAEVTASQINGVKIRFLPEMSYKRGGTAAKGRRATRALTDVDISWMDVEKLALGSSKKEGDENDDTPPAPEGGGNGSSGELGE